MRTLNWNNRHRKLTATEMNRGFVAPRDYTRNAPRLSNGRHVPVNTRVVTVDER